MEEEVVDSMAAVADSVSAVAMHAQTAQVAFASGNYQEAIQSLIQAGTTLALGLATRIIGAIVVYLIFSWVIRKINKFVADAMAKRGTDASLSTFLKSLVNIVLNFLMIIVLIDILGVETSSFIALFASAGVAIGMALSGTLQNFAGGVMILLFKPYRVGDYVEAQGVTGTVKEIQIFNTIILTNDNKSVIIPNSGLSTGVVVNYSKEPRRRVDFEFSIAYGDDYDKAKRVLLDIINNNKLILKGGDSPEPFVALTRLNSSSVDIVVRVWVLPENYWSVYFQMNEDVYKTFAKENLSIPFPQMDVHVHQS